MFAAKKSTRHIPGSRRRRRQGTTMVEMAIIAPIAFLLLIGLMVGGLGVFRYHQIAALSHEAARWASVHGKEFAKATDGLIAVEADIYKNIIEPRAVGLNLDKIAYELDWGSNGSTVAVTVSYQWLPEAFFSEATLSSTAEALVTY